MSTVLILASVIWLFSKKVANSYTLTFALFLLYVTTTYILWVGFTDLITVITIMFTVFLCYTIISTTFINKNQVLNVFWVMVSAAFSMSINAIQQEFTGIGWTGEVPYSTNEGIRVKYVGVFNDPNDMGMFLVSVIPILIYQFTEYKKVFIKLIILFVIGSVFYAIFLTNSRGTALGLFSIGGYYLITKIGLKRALILFIPIISVSLIVFSRLSTISTEEESAQGRIFAWIEAIEMLKYSRYLGVGLFQFTEHHYLTAHSSYYLAIAELGLIGYMLWFRLVISPVLLVRKVIEDNIDFKIIEKNLLVTLFYSNVALLATGFFLSRSYKTLLFIPPALIVGYIMNEVKLKDKSQYYEKYMSSFYSIKMAIISLIGFISLVIVLG